MKHIWRLLIVALMVCAAEVPLCASDSGGTGTATLNSGTSAAFSVWISPAMVRVGKTDTPGTTTSINLFGARGETLDTQIIVSAGSGELSNVNLSASALTGPGGVTIAASNVVLYREYYVTTSGTIRSGGINPPMGAGTYADPLIPFIDPQTGAPLNGSLKAVPATVAAGQNQPFWVDISVPRGASKVPPGIYNGTITVTTSQGSVGVPVSVTVWNFELPLTPSAFSEIDYGASSGETTRGFNQLLMRHKLMPRNDNASSAASDMATLGLNRSGLDGYYYIGIQCNGSYTNLPSQSQIASAAANFPAGLPLDFRPGDEIDGCTGAYGPLKTLATNAHPNGVKLNLTTTSPDPNLYGVIDRWIVIPAGGQWPTLPFTHGELWSYASCWVGNGSTPEWMIDYAPINPRMQSGFLNWTQGATGVLYWAVNNWNAGNTIASWDNVDTTWCGSAAGDGIFIYPPGPIGSSESAPGIRLKAIRDGIQDYEYAQLLKNAGQSSFVSSTLQSIAASWTNWTKDPTAVAAARLQLGQKLDQLSVPAIAVTPSSQDFGTVIVGSSANRDFTVQNTGGGTLSGTASTSLPYSIFSGGSYNLGAGQSQTVTVWFSPSSAGTFIGNVTFTGGGRATGIVTGVGVVARTLTVASSNPNSGVAITVGPNDNNGQGNGTTQFTRTYNNNVAVTLTAAAAAGGNNFSNWSGCNSASGTTCNVTMNANKMVTAMYGTPPATITLSFDGLLRDRVGQNNLARAADGQADGTFTVTYTGGGPRTLAQLKLTNDIGGVWDTVGATGFWTLGTASGLDAALLNASDDSVNLELNNGDSFKIFAADFNNTEFVSGRTFTLTATFSDSTTAPATVTIGSGPFTLTVGSVNPNSGASITVTPNDNSNQGNGTTQFSRTYNSNATVTLTAAATAGGNNFSGWSGCDSGSGTTCNVTMNADKTVAALYGTNTSATISLSFDGLLRDRVGQNNLARTADSQLDGTFTVGYQSGGARTLTQLRLTNSLGGVWDTIGGSGNWTLGTATGLDTALLNGSDDSVSFGVNNGNGFKIFASDLSATEFQNGTVFTLTATFLDGSSATANFTIAAASMSLTITGKLRDRVGSANLSRTADDQLDAEFHATVMSGGPRTITFLKLTNSIGGVWDTDGSTGFWTLGVALTPGGPLLNSPDDSVNFAVSNGDSFYLFAADFNNTEFLAGRVFVLTVTFADGTTALGNLSVP